MDSTASPKMKTTEGEEVWAHSLACNTLKVRGHARASGWGLGRLTSKSIIHTNLHKPNNKLVNVQVGTPLVQGRATGEHQFTRLTTTRTWGKPPPSPYSIPCA